MIERIVGLVTEVHASRAVLWRLVRQQLILRYRRTVLGYLWTLINPLLMMSVMAMVFATIFKEDVKVFAVFLFAGMIPWNCFNSIVVQSSGSFINNEGLIKKIYLPRELFPVSSLWVAGIHFVPQLVVLLAAFVGLPIETRSSWPDAWRSVDPLEPVRRVVHDRQMRWIAWAALGVGALLSGVVVVTGAPLPPTAARPGQLTSEIVTLSGPDAAPTPPAGAVGKVAPRTPPSAARPGWSAAVSRPVMPRPRAGAVLPLRPMPKSSPPWSRARSKRP